MESLHTIHAATLREAADGHMGQSLARLLIEALRDSSSDLNPFALRDQTLSALNIGGDKGNNFVQTEFGQLY